MVSSHRWLAGVLSMLCGAAATADDAVPSGYRAVAAAHGIPSELFYAMALAESGQRVDGKMRPWPWTLNIEGSGHFYPSRAQARIAFEQALAAGQRSVDVGLMQINWRYHHSALGPVQRALDPYHNLRTAALLLERCYQARPEWWAAVGCYHAPNDAARAHRYQDRVRAIWGRLLHDQSSQQPPNDDP